MISDCKVILRAYVFKDVKTAADEVAAEKRLSTSAWVQTLIVDAIKAHRITQARKAAAANYTGDAPL